RPRLARPARHALHFHRRRRPAQPGRAYGPRRLHRRDLVGAHRGQAQLPQPADRRQRGRGKVEPRPAEGSAPGAPGCRRRGGMTEDKSLLIVDDDAPFRRRLAQAMEKRGFAVVAAESVAAGIEAARAKPPAYAVVDLKLGDGNGLEVVKALREVRADARVVVLTGYANIATAVAAEKTRDLAYL